MSDIERLAEKLADAYFNRTCGRLDTDQDAMRLAVEDVLTTDSTVDGIAWVEIP